mmetsp:Transcript_2121/g.6910  ORF Transcript_2121/g.6910 Transcript_2121/m.6910 type:complete len:450 (+) Transcript_2121:751-2100(+)
MEEFVEEVAKVVGRRGPRDDHVRVAGLLRGVEAAQVAGSLLDGLHELPCLVRDDREGHNNEKHDRDPRLPSDRVDVAVPDRRERHQHKVEGVVEVELLVEGAAALQKLQRVHGARADEHDPKQRQRERDGSPRDACLRAVAFRQLLLGHDVVYPQHADGLEHAQKAREVEVLARLDPNGEHGQDADNVRQPHERRDVVTSVVGADDRRKVVNEEEDGEGHLNDDKDRHLRPRLLVKVRLGHVHTTRRKRHEHGRRLYHTVADVPIAEPLQPGLPQSFNRPRQAPRRRLAHRHPRPSLAHLPRRPLLQYPRGLDVRQLVGAREARRLGRRLVVAGAQLAHHAAAAAVRVRARRHLAVRGREHMAHDIFAGRRGLDVVVPRCQLLDQILLLLLLLGGGGRCCELLDRVHVPLRLIGGPRLDGRELKRRGGIRRAIARHRARQRRRHPSAFR